MKPIIEVRNISKEYKIGQKQRYLSLRDSITGIFSSKNINTSPSTFWALDDVSFDVQAGESLGIIGRNGAGKSTLLKILSRITPPTKGNVILRGRLASLLEVGTGFHPELTGRENVFMNGSILGLKKAEIAQKFDEIVAFSGVESFIDTPLKHYSSGMQLRLAFAVAAHLEPEILIIDEVLAVGDAEFQKKCLGKMDEVSKSGRTVLFVSHNLQQVKKLCTQSLLLGNGQIIQSGNSQDVITYYLQTSAKSSTEWHQIDDSNPNPYFHLSKFYLTDSEGIVIPDVIETTTKTVYLHIEGYVETPSSLLNIGFRMTDGEENPLFMSYHTDWDEQAWTHLGKGFHKLCAPIDLTQLNEGQYNFDFYLSLHCVKMLFTESDNIRVKFMLKGLRESSQYFLKRRNFILNPIINWQYLQ